MPHTYEPMRYGVEESISYLWRRLFKVRKEKPTTQTLFLAIAAEAEACLYKTDWETRIRRIENILSVINQRIYMHQMRQDETELDRLVRKERQGMSM